MAYCELQHGTNYHSFEIILRVNGYTYPSAYSDLSPSPSFLGFRNPPPCLPPLPHSKLAPTHPAPRGSSHSATGGLWFVTKCSGFFFFFFKLSLGLLLSLHRGDMCGHRLLMVPSLWLLGLGPSASPFYLSVSPFAATSSPASVLPTSIRTSYIVFRVRGKGRCGVLCSKGLIVQDRANH